MWTLMGLRVNLVEAEDESISGNYIGGTGNYGARMEIWMRRSMKVFNLGVWICCPVQPSSSLPPRSLPTCFLLCMSLPGPGSWAVPPSGEDSWQTWVGIPCCHGDTWHEWSRLWHSLLSEAVAWWSMVLLRDELGWVDNETYIRTCVHKNIYCMPYIVNVSLCSFKCLL